ncbi:MAG: O-antigen ligase family protein [Lachnospiraceae bacterium]
MIRTIIIFLALFGVIQFLTTIEVLPIRPVLNLIFYNDPSTDVVFHKYNYSRIMSTFMEPSYYAGFVVGAFYYLLGFRENWKSNAWIMIILIIEVIMTKSSTAYGAFAIVGILFILYANNISVKCKIMGTALALVGILIIYFGFYNILDEVIFSKDLTGSYSTRENMNTEAIEAFRSSILYGVGYKNSRGSSIIYSLLGQLGIIGLTLYIIISLGMCLHLIKLNGISFAILSAVVCQIIACPDLDLCTYWFWLYCAGAIVVKRKYKEGE